MKAVVLRAYGGPPALDVTDAADPELAASEVLVDVRAASVNPIDWKIREGLLRDFFDLELPHIMGRDMSGVVSAVGKSVTEIRQGDEVFGVGDPMRDGTHAQRVAIAADLVARKPAGLSHAEAASLGVAGLSALAGLEYTAEVKSGDKVLIHAGAGGVGSLAIQLAKHLGATVVTTTSRGNLDYVHQLGADEAIDYKSLDFAAVVQDCDVVFDTVGGAIHRRSFACLKPGGRLVYLTATPIQGSAPRHDVSALRVDVRGGRDRLSRLATLVEQGAIVPQANAVFPFSEARKAYDLVETGHARGKVVLTIR